MYSWSHPLRVRGLKQHKPYMAFEVKVVAPPAGAWIETIRTPNPCADAAGERVAPPAGAWIETWLAGEHWRLEVVAPPAGAWIETKHYRRYGDERLRRTPCGCVD